MLPSRRRHSVPSIVSVELNSATKRRIRGFPNKLSVSHTGLDFIHMFMCSYRAVSKSSILDKQEVTAGLT